MRRGCWIAGVCVYTEGAEEEKWCWYHNCHCWIILSTYVRISNFVQHAGYIWVVICSGWVAGTSWQAGNGENILLKVNHFVRLFTKLVNLTMAGLTVFPASRLVRNSASKFSRFHLLLVSWSQTEWRLNWQRCWSLIHISLSLVVNQRQSLRTSECSRILIEMFLTTHKPTKIASQRF